MQRWRRVSLRACRKEKSTFFMPLLSSCNYSLLAEVGINGLFSQGGGEGELGQQECVQGLPCKVKIPRMGDNSGDQRPLLGSESWDLLRLRLIWNVTFPALGLTLNLYFDSDGIFMKTNLGWVVLLTRKQIWGENNDHPTIEGDSYPYNLEKNDDRHLSVMNKLEQVRLSHWARVSYFVGGNEACGVSGK